MGGSKVDKRVDIDNIASGEIMIYGSDDGGTTWYPVNVASDGDVQVDVKALSVMDSNNSTTSTLGVDATYTGTSTDVTEYNAVYIQVYSDVASATDGIKLQTSNDGTNWDHEHTYTLTAGETKHLEESLISQYYRVVYVNGGTGQSTFRMSAKLLKTASNLHYHPIEKTITGDHPASVQRSILAAKKPDTSYTNIDCTAGGNLKVSIEEFDGAVSLPAGTNNIGDVDVLTLPAKAFTLDTAVVATNKSGTGFTLDADTVFDARAYEKVFVSLDTTHASNTSTDNTLHIISSIDGSAYDSYQTPFREIKCDDARVVTIQFTGGCYLKVRGTIPSGAAYWNVEWGGWK